MKCAICGKRIPKDEEGISEVIVNSICLKCWRNIRIGQRFLRT